MDDIDLKKIILSDAELSILKNINQIILPLGPQRNLTTFIGAIFSLHPEALTLNHAGIRILNSPNLCFFDDCRREIQENFLKASIRLLQDGERGALGGSILKAHAFADDIGMQNLYKEKYGDVLLKPNAKTLFWKDSYRIQAHLSQRSDGYTQLLSNFENVKFVLPVRNPIHSANSNIRTGHARKLISNQTFTFENVVTYILTNIRDLYINPALNPEHLLLLWEDDFDRHSLVDICKYCNLSADPWWLDTIATSVKVRPKSITYEEADIYLSLVMEIFADLPELQGRLRAFADMRD